MKPLSSLSLSLLSLALSACTVGPDYHAPDMSVPAHFSTQTADLHADQTAGQWWRALQDPALDQLIASALAHSPDILSAQANIRQARANLGMISASQLPQVNADGRLARDKFSTNSENFADIPIPDPRSEFTDHRLGFDASWEIDLFGHTRRSVESAQARLGGIEQQRRDTSLIVAAEVARNVIDYRYWQQRVHNAAAMLENRQSYLQLVQLQRKAGVASDNDVLLAQVAVNNSAANLPPLNSQQHASLQALTVLTDQTAENIAAQMASHASLPVVPLDTSVGLPSELLQRRPDVRIAERQLAAASADIGVAVADQYPRINLLGSGGWDSINSGKLAQQASRYWSLGPEFSIPLFNGGQLKAAVQSREAARDAALANYRKAVLVALSDTETAIDRVQQERLRLNQLQFIITAQEQQLKFAEQSYQVGETAFTGVLDARLQIASLNDQKLASQQALAVNLVSLYKALGGGWEKSDQ